ncbi:hypothetical protein KBX06_18830 [Micromonospora sp. C31]|uniref:hypothetical protein n=1 Tax=Micromonospora sp. C31 TaxID=2824876 RepID=UPI001B35FAA8|nr:hypothetical protein [Micromonospora sp. C31]MBQ1075205.1 hypothetical protein [Micromonospora sp. C31]
MGGAGSGGTQPTVRVAQLGGGLAHLTGGPDRHGPEPGSPQGGDVQGGGPW